MRRVELFVGGAHSVTDSCVAVTAVDKRFVIWETVLVNNDVDSSAVPDSMSFSGTPLEYFVHSARTEELGMSFASLPPPKKARTRSISQKMWIVID